MMSNFKGDRGVWNDSKNRTLEGENWTLGGRGGQKSSKFVRHHLWMIPYGGAVEITPVLLKYIHITLCLYTWKVGVDQFPTSLYFPAVLRSKYLIRRVYLWDNLLSVSVIIVFQEFIPLTEAFCSQLCAFSYFEVYTTMPPPSPSK